MFVGQNQAVPTLEKARNTAVVNDELTCYLRVV